MSARITKTISIDYEQHLWLKTHKDYNLSLRVREMLTRDMQLVTEPKKIEKDDQNEK